MQIFSRTTTVARALAGTVAVVALVLGGSLAATAAPAASSAAANALSADSDASPRATETAASIQAQAAAQATLQQTLAATHSAGTPVAAPSGPAAAPESADRQASAAVAKFTAGNIIDDSLFYTGTAMTASQVQSFLASKGSGCTAGALCLKNYRQTTYTQAADQMCGQYVGASNETAATIVYRVGQLCGVSQKVLLTLIQKESSLVATTSPSAGDYETATGYGCADTQATCDKYYYGFYNQVYNAAWQFKRYLNPPGRTLDFTYFPVGKMTSIQYNDDTSCGSSKVTITNAATAALYYYTPYQPNKAALANPYGTGDACSAYGNRNFFYVYSDWFGTPNAAPDQFFTDVTPTTAKYADIQWMASLGFGTGTAAANGTRIYSPTQVINRGTTAIYLYRYSGLPFTPPATPSFVDVPKTSGSYTAVEWMLANHLVTLPADKKFSPASNATRTDLAVWLSAYSGDTLPNPATPSFTDVPTSNPNYRAIEWIRANKISTGTGFGPATPVTRDVLAAFLHRYYLRP
ncbi:S-layer homology domain-containing protein [Subtercola boreus]|uniref:S-layer homology domain-containing protein n=1 Tax=Subtercola boreus TaxID=120213 RepID=UPI000E2A293D|nr:S-layer homology domain-containing protein [Subtercola boreus]